MIMGIDKCFFGVFFMVIMEEKVIGEGGEIIWWDWDEIKMNVCFLFYRKKEVLREGTWGFFLFSLVVFYL